MIFSNTIIHNEAKFVGYPASDVEQFRASYDRLSKVNLLVKFLRSTRFLQFHLRPSKLIDHKIARLNLNHATPLRSLNHLFFASPSQYLVCLTGNQYLEK